MAEDDAQLAVAEHAAGGGVVGLLLRHYLGPHKPGIEHPADRADSNEHVEEARSEHGHDGDDDDQERKGDDEIDDAAEQHVEPAAVIADEGADDGAEDDGKDGREYRDRQVDVRRPDDAREDVAAEIVGAEGMGKAGRMQDRRHVEGEGIVGRDPPRSRGDSEEEPGQNNADDKGAAQAQSKAATAQRLGPRAHVPTLGSSAACTRSVTRNTRETTIANASVKPWMTG